VRFVGLGINTHLPNTSGIVRRTRLKPESLDVIKESSLAEEEQSMTMESHHMEHGVSAPDEPQEVPDDGR
jgi:hypothetical protein